MLSYKLDFNSCAIRDGFRKSSHKYPCSTEDVHISKSYLHVYMIMLYKM